MRTIKWKQVLCFLILLAYGLAPMNVSTTSTTNDFSQREDYYIEFCMSSDLSDEEEKTCDSFYEYLKQKNKQMEAELAKIQKELKDIASDIKKTQNTINQLSVKIKTLQSQIDITQRNITALEKSIQLLEEQIAAREADIEKRHNTIKSRMESVQSLMATNAFADFIMGAKDFVDFIRRVEGVNDITEYDKQQIRDLEEQKRLLEVDKAELHRQKQSLEDKKAQLQEAKRINEQAKEKQNELLKYYHTREAQAEAAQQKAAQNLKEVQRALSDLSSLKNLKPSAGWTMPLKRFNISAGTWYYPASFCAYGANRCVHLGVDFAAPVGTPIYAPANAVILFVNDNCPTYGGLGNWCGTPGSAGAGNHVLMAMQVGGKTYAVKIGHMQSGVSKFLRWPSPDGKALVVNEGTQIGTIGSSGNSSGPHAHIEVMYFGTSSLESVITHFKTKGQFDFGLGWGNDGLKTTCNAKGYKAPCRYRLEEIFNVSVGTTRS